LRNFRNDQSVVAGKKEKGLLIRSGRRSVA
jgi:hypothetical protein